MKNKCLTLLFSSIILLTSCSTTTKEADYIFNQIDKYKCEVNGFSENSRFKDSEEIEIPKYSQDDKRIISVSGFNSNTTLKKVILPKTIQYIKQDAFSNSTSLKNVYFYKKCDLLSIDSNAFKECDSLKGMGFPSSIKTIGDYAFYGCDSLSSVVLPENLTSLGENSFSNCKSLVNVTINSHLDKLYNCFSDLESLEYVYLTKGAFSIKDFTNCPRLETVILGNDVTEILEGSFSNCGIKKIYIPDSVVTFEEGAFKKCPSDMIIYCGAKSKPKTWAKNWNSKRYEVIWNSNISSFLGNDNDYGSKN